MSLWCRPLTLPPALSPLQAERRLRDGRPTPIDMIAKNLHLLDEFDFDMVDPWRFFAGLLYEDMANLADEIKEYKVWGSVEVWGCCIRGHG